MMRVTQRQLVYLRALAKLALPSHRELAAEVGVCQGAASNMLLRLRRSGLVQREARGRSYMARTTRLTPLGHSLVRGSVIVVDDELYEMIWWHDPCSTS